MQGLEKGGRTSEGRLESLWNDIKSYLTLLRRAGDIKKRRKRKASQCSKFLKDFYRMTRSLLEVKNNSTLIMAKKIWSRQISDPERHHLLGSPGYVPHPPAEEFEVLRCKKSKVQLCCAQIASHINSVKDAPNF